MASILLASKDGDGVPLALRMAQEGHIVKIWFKEDKGKASLKGFKNPSQIKDPNVMLDQYDLVITDMVGLGPLMDSYAKKGKLILGGSSFHDKLELDRDYGIKVAMSLLKIETPTTESFSSPEECIKYIKSVKYPVVIKPLGNKPTGLTLVSSDKKNRTLISHLKAMGNLLVPCIIQERKEGIPVSVEGWFNGKEWVPPFNVTLEKKRLMQGDHGCNTGCMGNVVLPVDENKLVKTCLLPLTPLLKGVGAVGPIDVHSIATEDKAYFLEFTSRFGYDAIQAWMELLKESTFDYLYKIASRGKKPVQYYTNEYSIAVRLSTKPWPMMLEQAKDYKGIQLLDIPEQAQNHVWLSDVMLDEEGVPVLAGVDCVLGTVTARGQTIRECRRRVYRTVKNIVIHDDVQYREDIGEDVEANLSQLKDWGWLS